jgi:hypothetical protein
MDMSQELVLDSRAEARGGDQIEFVVNLQLT